MTPGETLRDGDHAALADALRELGEAVGQPIDGEAVAQALTSGLPDVRSVMHLADMAPESDVVELHRRLGALSGLLLSLLVVGDDMARDLEALHFEARPSVRGWQGVAQMARDALEVGCSKQSAGCRNCYAIGAAASVLRRLDGRAKSETGRATVEAYREALDLAGSKPRWSGRAVPMPHQLAKPLGWRAPRRVFVNSMSDLFHPTVSDDYIAAVFGVMAAAPQHTFQVLTKHPQRAAEWFRWVARLNSAGDRLRRGGHVAYDVCTIEAARLVDPPYLPPGRPGSWPLPNVWLGTSVEDQATADERIPHLLECPAAVRWVSYEPALAPVDFTRIDIPGLNMAPTFRFDALRGGGSRTTSPWRLNWIVVGGESGPGARPFDVEWARDTIRACREAGVPVFVKQLGARPVDSQAICVNQFHTDGTPVDCQFCGAGACQMLQGVLRDRKGGDMSEWPESLRVREYPEVTRG